jgi:hypothetical protein
MIGLYGICHSSWLSREAEEILTKLKKELVKNLYIL